MLIIDEIQRVPTLLLAIKKAVDEDARPGQYLLTGSANIAMLPSVQESLAGRIRKLRLRPLAQGELLGAEPAFFEQAFEQEFSKKIKSAYDRRTILEMAFRGGFPEVLTLKESERQLWHRDYIAALIEREDYALLGIEIKAGSAISSADFKHLKWFKDNIAKSRPFVGVVLYSGELAGSMGKNLWALPYAALWS